MVQGGAGDAMETHARFFEHSQRFHRLCACAVRIAHPSGLLVLSSDFLLSCRPGQVQRGRQFAPTPPTSCRLDAKPNGWLTHRESEAARTPMPSDMWDRGSDDTSSWLDAYTPTRGWTGKTSTSATRGGNDRQRRMQGGIWLDEGSEIKSPSVHSKKRLGPTFSTVLDFEAPGSHSRDTSYQDAFPTSKSSPARIAPCTVNRMSIRPQTAQDPAFHPGRWQCLDPTSDERVRDFFERFWYVHAQMYNQNQKWVRTYNKESGGGASFTLPPTQRPHHKGPQGLARVPRTPMWVQHDLKKSW